MYTNCWRFQIPSTMRANTSASYAADRAYTGLARRRFQSGRVSSSVQGRVVDAKRAREIIDAALGR